MSFWNVLLLYGVRLRVKKLVSTMRSKHVVSGPCHPSSGFTLLELLISMVILSISFLAIIPLLINTMNLNKTTDMATVAKDLASQKVEEIMSTDSQVVTTWLGANQSYVIVEYITSKGVVSTTATADSTYTRTCSINKVPVRNVLITPSPVAITAVVEYVFKGQKKSRAFTSMWSF